MRRLLIILLVLIFSISGLFSQKTTIVNGYKVARGERPIIDLSKVPVDAYEPGKIRIKLAPEMEDFIKDDKILISDKGAAVSVGVANIDKMNTMYNVAKVKPKQYGYYQTSPVASMYRERHKAWGFHLWMEVDLDADADIISAVKDYMALDEVDFAEPIYKAVSLGNVDSNEPFLINVEKSEPKFTVDDLQFNQQWHYHNTGQNGGTVDCDIDLPEAWDIERGNDEVIVAINDNGIQWDHPDLDSNMWSGIGYNLVNMDAIIHPHEHAAHVAGTVSAESNNEMGVAGIAGGTGEGDGVRLMSVQIFDGAASELSNLMYEYSADNGAAISQNSWTYNNVGYYSQLVLDGIDYFNTNGGGGVIKDGGLTIFAAGNWDSDEIYYPQYYSGCMAVAATTMDDERASYSSYGAFVEISAPGGEANEEGIFSCLASSNYGYYYGTSMAAPHVSGVAALIVSMAPGYFTSQEVEDILKNTTDNIDAENPTYIGELGTGRLNAYAALEAVVGILTNVERPESILASPVSVDQVDIEWVKNATNDDVMLAWSLDGVFGTPENGTVYSVGQTIPGGGKVLSTGSSTSYSHTALSASTDYYYRAYSYDNSDEYSFQVNTNATTFMLPIYPSASSFGFENGGNIPSGWSVI